MADKSPSISITQRNFRPKDIQLITFRYEIKIEDYKDVYIASKNHPTKFIFPDNVVGDRDVVFEVEIIIDEYINIKLHRKSQRLGVVLVKDCFVSAVTTAGRSIEEFDFNTTSLRAGSVKELYSTISADCKWKESRTFHLPGKAEIYLLNDALRIQIQGDAILQNTLIPVECTLQYQMEYLLNNAETSDLTLVIGDEKFAAHKWLLSARSPVFQAMFSFNMKESTENIVKLSDKPEVFKEVLNFMYTDECSNLATMAPDLLFPADKYDIQGLRSLCENEMMKYLSVNNVCDYLVKSGLTNSHRMYKECLDFFKLNIKDIVTSDGWTEMRRLHSCSPFMPDIIERLGQLD